MQRKVLWIAGCYQLGVGGAINKFHGKEWIQNLEIFPPSKVSHHTVHPTVVVQFATSYALPGFG